MTHRRLVVPAVLVLVAAGLAIAQPGGGRPGGRAPGVPGVPGVPSAPGQPGGGQPGFNPQQLVDRLMEMDANGDGKLARSEVPAQFADRNFDRYDTNGDGFVDRAELEAGAANLGGGGGRGAGGGGGRMPLGRAMESIEGALHALEESAMTAGSRGADLAQVQTMQEGFLAAKFHSATERFPAAVLEQFNGSEAEARADFRANLIEAMVLALELETALMDGDSESARELLGALEELEHASHDRFRVD